MQVGIQAENQTMREKASSAHAPCKASAISRKCSSTEEFQESRDRKFCRSEISDINFIKSVSSMLTAVGHKQSGLIIQTVGGSDKSDKGIGVGEAFRLFGSTCSCFPFQVSRAKAKC